MSVSRSVLKVFSIIGTTIMTDASNRIIHSQPDDLPKFADLIKRENPSITEHNVSLSNNKTKESGSNTKVMPCQTAEPIRQMNARERNSSGAICNFKCKLCQSSEGYTDLSSTIATTSMIQTPQRKVLKREAIIAEDSDSDLDYDNVGLAGKDAHPGVTIEAALLRPTVY